MYMYTWGLTAIQCLQSPTLRHAVCMLRGTTMLTPSTILTAGVGANEVSTSGENAKDGAIVIGTGIATGVTIGVNATVTAAMTESRPEVEPAGCPWAPGFLHRALESIRSQICILGRLLSAPDEEFRWIRVS